MDFWKNCLVLNHPQPMKQCCETKLSPFNNKWNISDWFSTPHPCYNPLLLKKTLPATNSLHLKKVKKIESMMFRRHPFGWDMWSLSSLEGAGNLGPAEIPCLSRPDMALQLVKTTLQS